MPFDVLAVRKQFPALAEGAAHFDGPGGSQVPRVVADAIARTLCMPIANRGLVTVAERNAEKVVQDARQAIADLLNAEPPGIVFGRSMTQLTYDFSRTLAKEWQPGDEIVVTRLDHDANVRPWVQAAAAAGVRVVFAEFDRETGELGTDHIARALSDRTRLVAVTGASNLIGTRPPVREIADLVHVAGALVYVDGVHLTPHSSIDIDALGADFFVCSPYKFFGPHCGALAASPDLLDRLRPDKLLPATDQVPERFEFGTLPYELLAGTTACVDFIAGLAGSSVPATAARRERLVAAMAAIEEYEHEICGKVEQELASMSGIVLHGHAAHSTPTLLLSVHGRDSSELYRHLATRGVNAPAGSFYALEASRWLGLGDTGALRIGIAPYTDGHDTARLLDGVDDFLRGGAGH